eukprot:1160447-Pelagomonas_calceolata.AAC.6
MGLADTDAHPPHVAAAGGGGGGRHLHKAPRGPHAAGGEQRAGSHREAHGEDRACGDLVDGEGRRRGLGGGSWGSGRCSLGKVGRGAAAAAAAAAVAGGAPQRRRRSAGP